MGDATIYGRLTLRMVRVVSRLALHDSYETIAGDLSLDRRTVAGDVARAKTLTGCETQAELVHWWHTNYRPFARWLLESLGIDPLEMIV